MKYELSPEQVKNLRFFLDRLDYKGLVEAAAVMEILAALSQPVKEEKG